MFPLLVVLVWGGASIPSARLQVSAGGGINLRLQGNPADSAFYTDFVQGYPGGLTITQVQHSYVNTTLVLDKGKVGIGITAPGSKLHVQAEYFGHIVLIAQGTASQGTYLQEWQNSNAAVLLAISANGDLVANTTNGIRIGTATSQKLGFFNATPVVQQTGGVATAGALYTATEQTMLQTVYNALRTFGFLS